VTGASGFIGSHLVEELVGRGYAVRCLIQRDSDREVLDRLDVDIVVGDILDSKAMEDTTANVSVVYHLAAIPNWQAGISNSEYHDTNVLGTRRLLEAACRNDVKRFLLTSSMEVVGPSLDGKPVNEATRAHPTNVYGMSKKESEMVVDEYHRCGRIDTVVVRLPTVYGPRNTLHLKRFFRTARSGYFPLVGDGKALMEFCYVGNAVHGLILATEKAKPGDVFFVSDETSYTLEQVIGTIGAELGVKVRFIRMPKAFAWALGWSIEALSKVFAFPPFILEGTGRPVFSRRSVEWMAESRSFCSVEKARATLGYRPPYSLREGTRETIRWFREARLL